MTLHTNARDIVKLARRSTATLAWLSGDTVTQQKTVERLRHYYSSTLDKMVSYWVDEVEEFEEVYTYSAFEGKYRGMTLIGSLEQISGDGASTHTYTLSLSRGNKKLRTLRLQEATGPANVSHTEGHLSAKKGYDALLQSYRSRRN